MREELKRRTLSFAIARELLAELCVGSKEGPKMKDGTVDGKRARKGLSRVNMMARKKANRQIDFHVEGGAF